MTRASCDDDELPSHPLRASNAQNRVQGERAVDVWIHLAGETDRVFLKSDSHASGCHALDIDFENHQVMRLVWVDPFCHVGHLLGKATVDETHLVHAASSCGGGETPLALGCFPGGELGNVPEQSRGHEWECTVLAMNTTEKSHLNSGEPVVRHDPAQGRYSLVVAGDPEATVGILQYYDKTADGLTLRTITSTVVSPEHEGKGYAGRLAERALADARAHGVTVEPTCSYIARYLQRHPEYADLRA